MSELRPYPKYKAVPVPYLDALPVGWEIRPAVSLARVLTSTVDKHTVPGDVSVTLCNYTNVYYNDVISNSTGFMQATADRHQIDMYSIKRGDVAFTKDSETADDIGISAYIDATIPGTVYGYHLAVYRPNDIRYGRFLKWLLDSKYAKAVFRTRTLGVTRVGLSQNTIRYLRIPTPPPDEAEAVASFLDRETAEIDAFIADQEKLIALLAERRSAAITHALDGREVGPHVPLRRVVATIEQGWSPVCENHAAAEGQWGVLKVSCVNGGRFNPKENKALPLDIEPREVLRVSSGDVLVSRGNTRDLVGSAALVNEDHPSLMISDLVYRLRVDGAKISAAYLTVALGSTYVRGQLESSAKGTSSSMQKLSQGDVLDVVIRLPDMKMQLALVEQLDRETAELDAAIADAREAVALSKERRAALISAAVTGKIDVRGAVRRLRAF